MNYLVTNKTIVLNFEGRTVALNNEDKRYNDIILAIKENRLDDIPDLLDVETKILRAGFQLVDGLVYKDNAELPKALSDRLIELMDAGLPIDPLLNLWDKLENNPSFNSRKMLYKFLEHNGHPITQDGCFIAYRGVTRDFKDPHTRKFDNSVGSVCEMPRDQVDDNPDNTCSSGLHVACYSYANGFGAVTVEVKVDPRDVVCVPRDYNGTKMRTCKFEVLNVVQNENNDQIYGYQAPDVMDDLFEEVDDTHACNECLWDMEACVCDDY